MRFSAIKVLAYNRNLHASIILVLLCATYQPDIHCVSTHSWRINEFSIFSAYANKNGNYAEIQCIIYISECSIFECFVIFVIIVEMYNMFGLELAQQCSTQIATTLVRFLP